MKPSTAKFLVFGFWVSVIATGGLGISQCTKAENRAETRDEACYNRLDHAVREAPQTARAVSQDGKLTRGECGELGRAIGKAREEASYNATRERLRKANERLKQQEEAQEAARKARLQKAARVEVRKAA